MAPRTKNDPENQSFGPLLGAMLGTKIDKNRSKSDPKGDHFFDWFLDRILVQLGANLAPTWLHFGRVLEAKLGQVAPKFDPKTNQKMITF